MLNSIPSSVPRGTKIYKDDCMFSYDTAENNALGLDVCLECFQAFARATTNYTQEHAHDTQHNYYLNIVKQLKPVVETPKKDDGDDAEGGSPAKIQKLEVKDVAEEDIYDFNYALYDATADTATDIANTPANIQNLVKEIISSNSSDREDEIKVWEQEILPCEHSLYLPTRAEQVPVDLTQCSLCDLKENLWICLHCGSMGCGRTQFGLTLKGNGHALAHFEQFPDHPVALKLGSLDIDNYDSYCYKCNDEIKVPDLATKLLAYGIDLARYTKTEKNLIELNIDQNMNWDFKLDGVNGGKLEPVFGAGLTGFQNLGNSCYINSVMQALFGLPEYQKYFELNPGFAKGVNPSTDLRSQLLKMYDGLLSGRFSVPSHKKDSSYQLGLKPLTFKTLVGENHPEFKTQKQQDAFEFLTYFLEKSSKDVGSALNLPFKFVVENKIKCLSCNSVKLKSEVVDSLAVPISDEVDYVDPETSAKVYKKVTLKQSFDEYCLPSLIEDYKCPSCQSSETMVASIRFKSYPDVLIVNAKRIKLENWVPVKIDVPIEIPNHVDLSSFKAKPLEEGEQLIVEDCESTGSKFDPSQEALDTLLSMGFPEPRCIKALYETGNSNAEEAMNWLFQHMDDADIDAPLEIKGGKKSFGPSQDAIDNLCSMGFSPSLAKKALVLNADPNAAVEWLFNNPDDDGVIVEETVAESEEDLVSKLEGKGSPNYKLKAVVCHKGTSPHTGHYVVFIKKIIDGVEKWVLFNDEKVVVCGDDLGDVVTNGYIYIFETEK